jgi:protein-disulfide isomerase
LQAGLLVAGRRALPWDFDAKNVTSGGATAAIVVAVAVIAYNLLHSATPAREGPTAAQKDVPTLSPKAEEIPVTKSAYAGLGEDYRKGGDDAKVTIVEFADFQCPACRSMTGTLDALQKEYGDRVLFVFRNYPLDAKCNSSISGSFHENACNAATLARCAGQYGKFWQFYETAYANQKDMSPTTLKQWANDVGLTDEQITQCQASQDILAKIKDDVALGNKLGIDSTPTIYINGRKVLGGRSAAELRTQIDQLLN